MDVEEMEVIEIVYTLPVTVVTVTLRALRWALKTHSTIWVL